MFFHTTRGKTLRMVNNLTLLLHVWVGRHTGIPCVGEQGLNKTPKIHEGLEIQARYNSFVDCPSNPEMYVIQNPQQIYPAYIIHFS